MNELPGHWPALLVAAWCVLTAVFWVGTWIEQYRPVRRYLSEKSPHRLRPYFALGACLLAGMPATATWVVAIPYGAPSVAKISFAIAASACAVGLAAAYEAVRCTRAAGRGSA